MLIITIFPRYLHNLILGTVTREITQVNHGYMQANYTSSYSNRPGLPVFWVFIATFL